MKRLYLLAAILIIFEGIGHTQERECGFDHDINPFGAIDAKNSTKLEQRGTGNCCNTECIPVVFHIIHHPDDPYIPDEFILGQFRMLNSNFKGYIAGKSKIPPEFRKLVGLFPYRFCLASSGEDRNVPAILRVETNQKKIGVSEDLFNSELGGSTPFDTELYLNIWIADCGDFISGFASKPGQEEKGKSGIIINPIYFNSKAPSQYSEGKVLVHEIGHYLGLEHTWGHGYGCDIDDGIGDTPLQYGPYFGCPDYPSYSCNTSNMFMNYMDYVDDQCMVLFTMDQTERMTETLNHSRPGILHNVSICYEHNKRNVPFALYPNPAREFIFLSKQDLSLQGTMEIKFYDVLGQMKYELTLGDDDIFPYCLDISTLETGIYLVQLSQLRGVDYTIKFAKFDKS